MPDILNKVLKFIDYHRYSTLAIGLAGALLVFVYTPGCQSTAPSPLTGKQSTADALVVERDAELSRLKQVQSSKEVNTRNLLAQVQTDAQAKISAYAAALQQSGDETAAQIKKLNDQYALAGTQIEQKDATINKVYDLAVSSGLANSVPGGALVLGTIGTIFGLGATADNKRKNVVIAALKSGDPVPAA